MRGFTLPELVMVIVIIGILAVMAAPRLMSSQNFLSRGFYDEAKAVLRFAQKTAIARRATITVCVTATEISAISNPNCASPAPILHPVGGAPLKTTVPDGVTLTSSHPSFTFDSLGRSSAAVTITMNSSIADDPARAITVALETGYVR